MTVIKNGNIISMEKEFFMEISHMKETKLSVFLIAQSRAIQRSMYMD